MFEHRTEAEMRLYSEKTARELAVRRQKESDAKSDSTEKAGAVDGDFPENSDITENDDVVDTRSGAGEEPATTGPTVTAAPE
ncbi:hypothetical protein ACIRQQ_02970 [Streptomyces fuscichromogenes]|uniref:hypothetical protein n=1 Tax=Streptomyces fuscichromogenes TaxID=1324013 RepID=UPI00380F4D8E